MTERQNTAKNKLIFTTRQDFRALPTTRNGAKQGSRMTILKKSVFKNLTLLIALFVSILPSNYASAMSFGSFSNFNPINKAFSETLPKNDVNSQNVPVLQAAVNIDPNPSKDANEVIVVEGMALMAESGLAGTSLDIEIADHTGTISVYEVREGDTLSQIADMFHVSVNTIKWANDLKGPIAPGQTLLILPVTGITHTVKIGGTIQNIARIYDADINEIALFNGLDENTPLTPGQKIIVPNVELSAPSAAPKQYANGSTPIASKFPINTKIDSYSYFINPVPTGVLTQNLHGYNGVDIGAPFGTPIYAAAAGTVIKSTEVGWNGGYGKVVIIAHSNGVQTIYAHNSSNVVVVGQSVERGTIIGYVGSTGNSTGNHTHFEIRGATNPLSSCAVGQVCKF